MLIGMILIIFLCVTGGMIYFVAEEQRNKKIAMDALIKENKIALDREPYEPHDVLMTMLDNMIDRAVTIKYMLQFDIHGVYIIKDFAADSEELVKTIINGIAPGVWRDLEYYHTRHYIITYVTQRIHNLLMRYTNEKKFVTQSVHQRNQQRNNR